MTPKDRSELIELMARAVDQACNGPRTPSYDPVYVVVSPADIATTILSALNESGLAIVPVEATEGMVSEFDGLHVAPSYYECPRFAETWTAILNASPFQETVEYEPGAIR